MGDDDRARWNGESQRWETAAGRGTEHELPAAPSSPPPAHEPAAAPERTGSEQSYEVTNPPGTVARPRRRTALIVAVVVAALAGGAGAALLTVRDDETGAGRPGAGAASSISTPGPGSGDEADPGIGPGDGADSGLDEAQPTEEYISALPDAPGYVRREEGPGFNIAVPERWERVQGENSVSFNSPDGKSLMEIVFLEFREEPDSTPQQEIDVAAEYLAEGALNYQEISRGDCTRMPGGAQLAYALDFTDGSRSRLVLCYFTEYYSEAHGGGVQYQVVVAGPEEDWPRQNHILKTALEHFGQW